MSSPAEDYSLLPFTDDHLLWVLKMGVDRKDESASHENIQLDLYDYCHGDKVAEQNVVKHLPHNNHSKAKVIDCDAMDSANHVAFYIKFVTEENAAVAEKLTGLAGSDSATLYTVRGRSAKTLIEADSPKGIGEDIDVEDNNSGGDHEKEEEMVDDEEEMNDDEEMVDEEPPIQIDGLELLGSKDLDEIVYTGGIEYYIGTEIKTFLDKRAAILEIRKQTEPTPGAPEYRLGPADAKGVIVAMTVGNANNYLKNLSWVTKVVASGYKRADDYTLSFKD